ncbi:MAG: YihY/virulence factor BrkB family protein [Thermoflexaceae bacterium]|nr:YihY/virulence factor BrkB family protein [Thermoflexaceae bacterium]
MFQRVEAALSRAPGPLKEPVSLLITTVRFYSQDQCNVFAAAIAYYAIFSLVPLALVVLAVLGAIVPQQDVVDFVFDQVPLEESPSVRADVEGVVRRAQQVTLASVSFGFIGLFWSASGMFSAVRRGLDATAHRREDRAFWRGKLIDFALVPALGLLILLSLSLTAGMNVAIERAGDLGAVDIDPGPAVRIAGLVLPALVSLLLFFLLYRLVPTVRPATREAFAGAVFATFLFELAKNLVAVFLGAAAFSREAAVYAGIGSALAFLFWMFVNASILLLGSEFGRALAHRNAEDAPTGAAGESTN